MTRRSFRRSTASRRIAPNSKKPMRVSCSPFAMSSRQSNGASYRQNVPAVLVQGVKGLVAEGAEVRAPDDPAAIQASRRPLRNRPLTTREEVEVDISARDHHAHVSHFARQLIEQHGSRRDGPARLDQN